MIHFRAYCTLRKTMDYTDVYLHVHKGTDAHTYKQTGVSHMQTDVQIHTSIHTNAHKVVNMHRLTYAYTSIRIYECSHIDTHMYTHTYRCI